MASKIVLPRLADVEATLGEKAPRWAGRCFEISCACVEKKVVPGVAVYGHFLGEVVKDSFFSDRRHLPFVQHGWVQLPDRRIWDPTRWAFENVPPYLYVAAVGEQDEYDEGGNAFRKALMRPPPLFDLSRRLYKLELDVEARKFVEGLLGPDYVSKIAAITRGSERADVGWGTVSVDQIFWLGNLPYEILGGHVAAIYTAIEKAGSVAAIPMDNYRRFQRESVKKGK